MLNRVTQIGEDGASAATAIGYDDADRRRRALDEGRVVGSRSSGLVRVDAASGHSNTELKEKKGGHGGQGR
jgi:hypothetical protein